jgi:hypothetical protein
MHALKHYNILYVLLVGCVIVAKTAGGKYSDRNNEREIKAVIALL